MPPLRFEDCDVSANNPQKLPSASCSFSCLRLPRLASDLSAMLFPSTMAGDPASEKENSGIPLDHSLLDSLLPVSLANHSLEDGTIEFFVCENGINGEYATPCDC